MPELRRDFCVLEVWVFGSVARGDAGDSSDVDLLVDLTDDATLFTLTRLQRRLQDALQVNVDLVPRDAMSQQLAARVLAEARRVA